MQTSAILLACFLFIATATAQPANHDLKLKIRHTFGSLSFDTTHYYSGERSRFETQNSNGEVKGHHRAIIRQRGANRIQVYDLDLDAKEFVSYQTDLNGGALHGGKSWIARPSGKTLEIYIESVDTGERREMFGHEARHIITREKRVSGPENCYSGNSESEMDGWYIDYSVFPDWHRPKENTVDFVTGGFRKDDHCTDKIEVHRTGPATGYPLRLKTTHTTQILRDGNPKTFISVSELEVVELSEARLDPGLFQVPAGFDKVDTIVDPTQQPWRMQAMLYWQKLKNGLHDLFY